MEIKKNSIRIINNIIYIWVQAKQAVRKKIKFANSGKQLQQCQQLDKLLKEIPSDKSELILWAKEVSLLIEETIFKQLSTRELSLFITGILACKKTNECTPGVTRDAFVAGYEETNGALQEIAHNILFSREEEKLEIATSLKDNLIFAEDLRFDTKSRLDAMNALQTDGYVVFSQALNDLYIKKILSTVQSIRFTIGAFKDDLGCLINPHNPPACNVSHALKSDLNNAKEIEDLLKNTLLEGLIKDYLGSEVKVIDKNLWYTFPASAASSNAAQLFHYDLDTLRWIKVFIYLSDVNEANGPHEYVKGTHRIGSKCNELLLRGYSRVTDEEIGNAFKGRSTKIMGGIGTIIIADTRCYHKGNNPSEGYRLILEYTYAPSKIGFNFN